VDPASFCIILLTLDDTQENVAVAAKIVGMKLAFHIGKNYSCS